MTAVGFVCFVFGFVFVRWFGVPIERSIFGQSNIFDHIGVPLLYVGFCLMVAGLAVRLWELMP